MDKPVFQLAFEGLLRWFSSYEVWVTVVSRLYYIIPTVADVGTKVNALKLLKSIGKHVPYQLHNHIKEIHLDEKVLEVAGLR